MAPKLRGGLDFVSDGSTVNPRLELNYQPRNGFQNRLKVAWEKWKDGSPYYRFLILTGIAGGGKSAGAMGQALQDLLDGKIRKILVSRPPVPNGDKLGYDPGDIREKMMPWLDGLNDALEGFSNATLTRLADYIEVVDPARIQGRTVRNAVLIIDEASNLTLTQINCAATRIGPGGRVVLCGDPEQSSLPCWPNPLVLVAEDQKDTPGCLVLEVTEEDQLRSEFVNSYIAAAKAGEERRRRLYDTSRT